MGFLRFVALGLAVASLSACASITRGTEQKLIVNTNPQGAACSLTRDGAVIGFVQPTPGVVMVDKSSQDIVFDCTLAGYFPSKHITASEAEMMTAGNLIFGGVVGLAIDAGSGAINKYPSNIFVTMQRDESTPLPPGGLAAAPVRAPVISGPTEEELAARAEARGMSKMDLGAAHTGSDSTRPLHARASLATDDKAAPAPRRAPDPSTLSRMDMLATHAGGDSTRPTSAKNYIPPEPAIPE